ncbi:MAG: ABC transporter substrate-binding protein [Lachnospiraceae bacterium]|nr:ABC transporter substrate-binding protein [Lachnospiraceae bacterium]
MKKKLLSVLLSTAMVSALLVGCNGTTEEVVEEVPETEEVVEGGEEEVVAEAAEEGAVLNIYCWNEEFKSRVEDHYPGYEKVDATSGKIGDVTVKFNITANQDNAYQNNLDEKLLAQDSAAADDKIDIFLIEADYALKYVDTDYALALSEIGITDADVAGQFQYTKDVVTDSNGNLKGSSWQGCPGALIYRRDIAEEVLGVSEPADVQPFVKDWDTFLDTAAKMKDKGYFMTSSVMDTYRTYSNNVSSKWVEGDKINIDANIDKWVDDSKIMADKGYAGTHGLWSDDWSKGFFMDGKVFCYFGPAWMINFSMSCDQEGSVGSEGQWAITEGPQGFFWGGTWMCVAAGTDNPTLCKDLVLTMTTDTDVLREITTDDDDFTNNEALMNEMAEEEGFGNDYLGGQNPLGIFANGVSTVDLSNLSAYDQGCNEEFQNAMTQYFNGEATKDEALELFYTAILEKYPNLSK